MARVVVITGAGAGVGRATVETFAREGWDVALLSRDASRLRQAADEARRHGVRALPIPTDVADAAAVESAADRVEQDLGPIDVWINVAMATVFAPVSMLTPAEIERGTRVTYLGQVHGMMSALARMRHRNRGTIVNVGSALAYRSVPLQAVYCGAKAAVRGFTDSLRSEILHDGLDIHLTIVDLPAVDTPQFDWALNKMPKKAMPIAPIYAPEVPARAIHFAATHRRREIFLGWSTLKAVIGNWIAPSLLDRYLASAGYSGQLDGSPKPVDAPGNLFDPVPGDFGAHGRFGASSRRHIVGMFSGRHRALAMGLGVAALALLARRRATPAGRVR